MAFWNRKKKEPVKQENPLVFERQPNLIKAVSSPDQMISMHDGDNGEYTFVNDYATELLGYEKYEFIGRPAYEFFHPDDIPQIRETHNWTLKGEAVTFVQYRIRAKSGDYLNVQTLSWTIHDKSVLAVTELTPAIEFATREHLNSRMTEVIDAYDELRTPGYDNK